MTGGHDLAQDCVESPTVSPRVCCPLPCISRPVANHSSHGQSLGSGPQIPQVGKWQGVYCLCIGPLGPLRSRLQPIEWLVCGGAQRTRVGYFRGLPVCTASGDGSGVVHTLCGSGAAPGIHPVQAAAANSSTSRPSSGGHSSFSVQCAPRFAASRGPRKKRRTVGTSARTWALGVRRTPLFCGFPVAMQDACVR